MKLRSVRGTHDIFGEEIDKFKIADCGGGDYTLIYYLNKYLGVV